MRWTLKWTGASESMHRHRWTVLYCILHSCDMYHLVLLWHVPPCTFVTCTTLHFCDMYHLVLLWHVPPCTFVTCTTLCFCDMYHLALLWHVPPCTFVTCTTLCFCDMYHLVLLWHVPPCTFVTCTYHLVLLWHVPPCTFVTCTTLYFCDMYHLVLLWHVPPCTFVTCTTLYFCDMYHLASFMIIIILYLLFKQWGTPTTRQELKNVLAFHVLYFNMLLVKNKIADFSFRQTSNLLNAARLRVLKAREDHIKVLFLKTISWIVALIISHACSIDRKFLVEHISRPTSVLAGKWGNKFCFYR